MQWDHQWEGDPVIVLGVDPGLSGAFALLDAQCEAAGYIFDMPTFEVKRGQGKRHDLDGHSISRKLIELRPGHAFIEQAQAMPGQSAYATGIFFQVYGELRGILIGLGIPFTVVHPRTWKLALGVPKEKDGARARASQLMPWLAAQWPLKKHDGRAEAALIALYGIRSLNAIASGKAA